MQCFPYGAAKVACYSRLAVTGLTSWGQTKKYPNAKRLFLECARRLHQLLSQWGEGTGQALAIKCLDLLGLSPGGPEPASLL